MRFLSKNKLKNKRVLLRLDLNVPIKNGKILNDKRIIASIPTIKKLHGNTIIICSHLGDPNGRDLRLSLKPVALMLSKALRCEVVFVPDFMTYTFEEGQIYLLENLRFNPEEKKNSLSFAKSLASLADIYVNDAFGTCHRKHASITGVPKHLDSYLGLLVEKELKYLSKLLRPKRPYVVVLGGAKVSDKISLIKKLIPKADALLIGGAMANTFLRVFNDKIEGFEKDKLMLAKKLLKHKKIMLPVDLASKNGKVYSIDSFSGVQYDIGPETISFYTEILRHAKTVFWNGPLGKFEEKKFSKGTFAIARVLDKIKGLTIAGGGDVASAIEGSKVKLSHVSTGGGAALEFIEGKNLVGIEAVRKN